VQLWASPLPSAKSTPPTLSGSQWCGWLYVHGSSYIAAAHVQVTPLANCQATEDITLSVIEMQQSGDRSGY